MVSESSYSLSSHGIEHLREQLEQCTFVQAPNTKLIYRTSIIVYHRLHIFITPQMFVNHLLWAKHIGTIGIKMYKTWALHSISSK